MLVMNARIDDADDHARAAVRRRPGVDSGHARLRHGRIELAAQHARDLHANEARHRAERLDAIDVDLAGDDVSGARADAQAAPLRARRRAL